jgi:hypothetical protein
MKYRETKYYKYQLMGDEVFSMMEFSSIEYSSRFIRIEDGTLRVKKFYAWDGSSVPGKKYIKWIWDCDRFCKTASLIHDSLYQIIREKDLSEDYRLRADVIYRKRCIRAGMKEWQANLRFWALRKWGSTKHHKPNPILID